jgi:hypothetical protein
MWMCISSSILACFLCEKDQLLPRASRNYLEFACHLQRSLTLTGISNKSLQKNSINTTVLSVDGETQVPGVLEIPIPSMRTGLKVLWDPGEAERSRLVWSEIYWVPTDRCMCWAVMKQVIPCDLGQRLIKQSGQKWLHPSCNVPGLS